MVIGRRQKWPTVKKKEKEVGLIDGGDLLWALVDGTLHYGDGGKKKLVLKVGARLDNRSERTYTHRGLEMGSSDDDYDDPFAGIYEAFSGLNEMDFELHGIYMDHEPRQEFVSRLDKCKDHFLNILLCDANIKNASMTDEVKDRVDHGNDLQNDEEAEEEVMNNYIIHDPNVRFSFMNDECGKWKGNICPYGIKKLNLFGKNFRLWLVVHSVGNVFEVRRACASYKVDLDGRECYSTNISPVNGSNMWPPTGYNKHLPPVGRKMPGRPRTKRRRHTSEKESCKNEKNIPIPMPPKKIGRPRKCDVAGSNPHVSGSNQHASQPPVTSTIPTLPSQQDSLHALSSNTSKKIRKLGLRGPSFRVGDIASVGSQSSEDKVNNQVPIVNDIPNEVAQAPAVNDIPLVNEVIEEAETEVSVKVPKPVVNQVHLVNNQVPDVNDIPNNVAQVPAVNDVPLVNEVIEEEDDIMVLEEEEAVDVPVKVAQDLKQSLDEVRDAINQILCYGNTSDASDVPLVNKGGVEPEFTKGHASDVLPDKIKISVEEIADLLEAGYSMAEI
ncbi:unnamed protein product [Lactuca virosa]|uniref:Uncharacterized protein n=1 Tax=Lactuca virosa TaxID=75947 RepID=A0AAU9LH87_9ASTR|nr:unnamed protein product [Lactuca virosa]